jgi:purine-cytosine permease-like protein
LKSDELHYAAGKMTQPETRPTADKIPHWAIRLLVAVALPTVACFGYYAVSALDERHFVAALFVALAYPLALIGVVGLLSALLSSRRTRTKIMLWSLVIALPVMLLVVVQS